MKRLYILSALLLALASYGQEIPTELSLAARSADIAPSCELSAPASDYSFYNKNYNTVFREYEYTLDALDRGRDRLYVQGDRLYSSDYMPVVQQLQYPATATNNVYYSGKDCAQAAFVGIPNIISSLNK